MPQEREAVDVVLGEPGVGDGAAGRLVVQLVRRGDVDAAALRQRGADDRDPPCARHQCRLTGSATEVQAGGPASG